MQNQEWYQNDDAIKIITPPDVIKAILINTPTDEKDFKFHAYIQNGDMVGYAGGTALRIPVGAPESANFQIPRATLEIVLAKVKSHKFMHNPVSDNNSKKLGIYWNEEEMTGVFETELFTETFRVTQPELNGLEVMDFDKKFAEVNKNTELNQYATFHQEIMERAVKTAKLVDRYGSLSIVANGQKEAAYISFDNMLTTDGMAEMLIMPQVIQVVKQDDEDLLTGQEVVKTVAETMSNALDELDKAVQSDKSAQHEPIEIDENIEAYILGCMNGNVSANDLEVEFDISNARAKQILKQLEDEDMVSLSHDDEEDPVYFVKMT